jgi:hypothetical protein
MALKRDGANLNIGATLANKLAITGEGSQPKIDAGGYAEIILAQDMKVAHLEHGVRSDVVEAET